MNLKERDDLLVRLDERTNNIWALSEKQETHLSKINSHLEDHSHRLDIVETQVKERTTSKVSRKAKVGYGSGILVFITLAYYTGQALGWW